MIDLRLVERGSTAAILHVLDTGFRLLWGIGVDEVRARYDPLDDLVEPAEYYGERGGIFLVLVDAGKIVGTGGVLGIDAELAELRRLWILPDYRGQGLGRRLCEALLVFARGRGYLSVRLEVATPEIQVPAVRLYTRLGFRPVAPFRDGPCDLTLEKRL
ncbi:MAG: GNAT family N-acetyltransferase [Candidatus Bipolaricaulota bacterium]